MAALVGYGIVAMAAPGYGVPSPEFNLWVKLESELIS